MNEEGEEATCEGKEEEGSDVADEEEELEDLSSESSSSADEDSDYYDYSLFLPTQRTCICHQSINTYQQPFFLLKD